MAEMNLADVFRMPAYVAFPIIVSYAVSLTFVILSAFQDHKWAHKYGNVLISIAVLQTVLALALLVRSLDSVRTFTRINFTHLWVQMLLLMHAVLPMLMLSSIWVFRVMIDAVLNVDSMLDNTGSHVPFNGKDYTYLTTAMVASSIYSTYTFGVLFANTAKFAPPVDAKPSRDARNDEVFQPRPRGWPTPR